MNATTLSRRRLLATMPAVAATALPAAATALCVLPTGIDDPIYALIAEHREAMREESAAYYAQAAAEEAIPKERRTWEYTAGDEGPPEGCIDDPEWIAVEMRVVRACDRESDTLLTVLTTPPTTLAGVVALLDYVALPNFPDEEGATVEGNGTILQNAALRCLEDIKVAAADFLPMIVEVLRKQAAA